MEAKIDWDNAPEGATHFSNSDCFYKIDKKGSNDYCYSLSGWVSCALSNDFVDALLTKPESIPAYTQAMCDAGELPSVGMKAKHEDLNNPVTIVFISETEACYIDEYLTLTVCQLSEFKPLTPPIELVDGKAYQFTNIEENTIHGIYNEDECSFKSLNVEWSVETCTNIKELEVK